MLSFPLKGSVCIKSIIHLLLYNQNVILAFNLATEKFSIINLPHESGKEVSVKKSVLMNVNGLLGFVCRYYGLYTHELHIWILEDHENCVWVKVVVSFYNSWANYYINMKFPYPLKFVNADEIVFSPRKLYTSMMGIYIYDMKSRCFETVTFTLGDQFLRSKTLELDEVSSYAESIFPLERKKTTS